MRISLIQLSWLGHYPKISNQCLKRRFVAIPTSLSLMHTLYLSHSLIHTHPHQHQRTHAMLVFQVGALLYCSDWKRVALFLSPCWWLCNDVHIHKQFCFSKLVYCFIFLIESLNQCCFIFHFMSVVVDGVGVDFLGYIYKWNCTLYFGWIIYSCFQ